MTWSWDVDDGVLLRLYNEQRRRDGVARHTGARCRLR